MGDTTIEDALEHLGSTKQRDRRDGLHELKHIISAHRRSLDLDDSAYHAILEALFRFVHGEKANYLRYSKAGKSQAATLLIDAAGVFRLAIDSGVKSLRRKTLKAVIEHIIEILPDEGGNGYCEPLATDYIRILKTILQYYPHPAHLKDDQWIQLVEFCNSGISMHVQEVDEPDSLSIRNTRASSPGSVSGVVTPITKSFVGATGKDTRQWAPNTNHLLSDLVSCLYYLLRVQHAQIMAVARACLDIVHDFLSNTIPLSQLQGQEKAFGCCNIILTTAKTENTELACYIYEKTITSVRRLWHPKAHDALKEQMLANLILGSPLLDRIKDGLTADLEPLLDTLLSEYCKRNERDLLQLEDLYLYSGDLESANALQFDSLAVRSGSTRVEQSAAILMMISALFSITSSPEQLEALQRPDHRVTSPRKRQRLSSPLGDFIEATMQHSAIELLARVQILAFLPCSTKELSIQQAEQCVEKTISLASSDALSVSSWAMCAIAGFAKFFDGSIQILSSDAALQIWNLGTRRLAQQATSRAACHMMVKLIDCGVVDLKATNDAFDAVLSSVEFNGPAALDEASAEFWRRLVFFKSRHSPSSIASVLEAMLRWLFLRWRPSRALSVNAELLSKQASSTKVILSVLAILTPPLSFKNTYSPSSGLSLIALAHLSVIRSQPLTDFLYSASESNPTSASGSSTHEKLTNINITDRQSRRLFGFLVGSLSTEVSSAIESLQEDGGAVRNITAEHIAILVGLCLTSFWASTRKAEDQSSQRLMEQAIALRSNILQLIVADTSSKSLWNGVLDSLGPIALLSQRSTAMGIPLQLMAEPFNGQFWRTAHKRLQDSANEIDLMDLDNQDNSQSKYREVSNDGGAHVDWLACYESRQAHRSHLMLRICYYSCSNSTESNTLVQLLELLLAKDASEFLACRSFLAELFESDDAQQCGERILSYLGDILHAYEFERSEIVMGTSLDVLCHYVDAWIVGENEEMSDLYTQFYEWFCNIALKKKIISPHTRIRLGHLIQDIIVQNSDPEFRTLANAPPPRALLLKILEESQVNVKYEIGIRISEIFGSFVLEEHDAMLEDIIEALPMDVDWLEGTAIRLLILSNLGSYWRTLIRRCLFALVEAPYLVPAVGVYAQKSVQRLTMALQLHSKAHLFRLFAPQITYTWLESRPLTALPYAVFGYEDVRAIVQDVQQEVTAQTLMKGRDGDARDLTTILSSPYQTLLQAAFGKTAAYAIARDAAIRPQSDQEAAEAVSRLRKVIGKEMYSTLLSDKFSEIVASLFSLLDRDDSVVKGFQRYDVHASSQTAYEQIISTCASTASLAVSQQPSFKASYLADEIDYICSRTGHSAADMWTPALYCFVFRHLISSIHPALGPLHSVSVIRRIRILISMAGQTALQDYPLEMTLHALRKFVDHRHCSEDVIGIFRYVVVKGIEYLQAHPQVLTSIAVATIISLRKFMNNPQDSTTQEQQYAATKASGEGFHTWLVKFVEASEIHDDGVYSKEHQLELLRAAQQFSGSGTAEVGTPDGNFLKLLLGDEVMGTELLMPSYRALILQIIQPLFNAAKLPKDDILYNDTEASKYAPAVLKSLDGVDSTSKYYVWAATVLGRAYNASGFICTELTQEIKLDFAVRGVMRMSQFLTSESRFAILSALRARLMSQDTCEVGFVERTLQMISTKAQMDQKQGQSTQESQSISDCLDQLPASLVRSLSWEPYKPLEYPEVVQPAKITESLKYTNLMRHSEWVQQVSLSLIQFGRHDQFLSAIAYCIQNIRSLATECFPQIVHLVLLHDFNRSTSPKEALSKAISEIFETCTEDSLPRARLMLELILYLRTQQMPKETSLRDRSRWLDVDLKLAADIAARCGMYKTALLLVESSFADQKRNRSRRSSVGHEEIPIDWLRSIFRDMDDKDSFLGLKQEPTLKAYMDRSRFENADFKSLSLLSAFHDSEIHGQNVSDSGIEASLAEVLDKLDLNGLSESLISKINSPDSRTQAIMFETARKLERWDLATPLEISAPSTEVFRAFQNIHEEASLPTIRSTLNKSLSNTLSLMIAKSHNSALLRSAHETVAALSEADDILNTKGFDELHQKWVLMQNREAWMLTSSLDYSQNLLSSRRTLLSMLSKSEALQGVVEISPQTARSIEVRSLLLSASLVRRHEALQTCLGISAQLDDLVKPCKELGVSIDVASQYEASNVLWDQGEMETSIRILQNVLGSSDLTAQDIPIAKSVLLAKLGQRLSEARLERPDEILKEYLVPAITALRDQTTGPEAGQVYHEFASFCDQQLQNGDSIEDMDRARQLRDRKEAEVLLYDRIISSGTAQGHELNHIQSSRRKAKQWLDIDQREYERLQQSRQILLAQSLENYILSLRACDTFDNDALRFATLWLEHSGNEGANEAATGISNVPSRKFAPLMNQWTSRLLDNSSPFQRLLSSLVFRICEDHPFHSMYHVFASSKSKGGKDTVALSRHAAANSIASKLKESRKTATSWSAIHGSSVNFVKFAQEKPDTASTKVGSRIPLRSSAIGQRLEQDARKYRIPPPTLHLELRADCDYSKTPVIVRFQSEFTLASGQSMPKILTAVGSNGKKYKQLFKGGNDDLRQDSIMEQVFEQVSDLLRSQRETRQRNLGIRTYKVLPLTATSGIIEFVSNTKPLHDYLIPAHHKYHPKDLKNTVCRAKITEVQKKPNVERIKRYREVCADFSPVLRYFFLERFEQPDDWYARRLAYTRSTAAISILGHILGLGDRHGHNILLDEQTGEVVHIDLGIAFEQGRVLPVPEVVPFRLTRDLVDGMGITKTEGVFRRCCEFTLDALRKEAGSIVTILDVLRYDPLYSWTLSPIRLRKLQEEQEQEAEGPVAAIDRNGVQQQQPQQEKKDEQGEADRALTVVKKKLSKTLSVAATVNELIQQATDERNLALLFSGWAAYA